MMRATRPELAFFVSLALLAACDGKPKERRVPVPMPMAPTAIAEKLKLDAGMLELPTDPLPPAGDLQGEAARFSSIDACVQEHARVDPLVGDSIRALGYDTFLRDTCRVLEAIKQRDLKRCDAIEVSSLRAYCQNTYATALGVPDACAFQNTLSKDRGRNPTCIAVASRSLALCASTETYVDRSSCEALVLQESFRCKPLPTMDRLRCEHDIERMRGFLAGEKVEKTPAKPAVGTIDLEAIHGSEAVTTPHGDFSKELSRGIVLTNEGGLLGMAFGTKLHTEGTFLVASRASQARMNVSIAAGKGGTGAKVKHIEVDVPGRALISAEGDRCDCLVRNLLLSESRGGEVSFDLDATLGSAPNAFKVRAKVRTFVRDMVVLGN